MLAKVLNNFPLFVDQIAFLLLPVYLTSRPKDEGGRIHATLGHRLGDYPRGAGAEVCAFSKGRVGSMRMLDTVTDTD